MCKRKRQEFQVNNDNELDALLARFDNDYSMIDSPEERLGEMRTLQEDAEGAVRYINAKGRSLRFTRGSYRQVANDIRELVKDLKTEVNTLSEQIRIQQALAARKLVEGNVEAGTCYIQFVNVGSGDCTTILTPKGKRILIDLGSDSLSDVVLDPEDTREATAKIRDDLRSDLFLGNARMIDFLLLTHPDADHHDKLESVLGGQIDNILVAYYGGTEKFSAFKCGGWVKTMTGGGTEAHIRKLTLRQESEKEEEMVVFSRLVNANAVTSTTARPDTAGEEWKDSNGAVALYSESGENNEVIFKLSVLASNVTGVWDDDLTTFVANDAHVKGVKETKLNGTAPNKRSMVMLVEAYSEKILINGDATAVTEGVLAMHFSETLGRVGIFRLGHHGSPTSSLKQFVDRLTGMKKAVVSAAGKKTVGHKLPRKEILSLYNDLQVGETAHTIYSFGPQASKASRMPFQDIKYYLYSTGSNDTVQYKIEKPSMDVDDMNTLSVQTSRSSTLTA